MIDEKLIALTGSAQSAFKTAGRKSDKQRVVEDLVEAAIVLFEAPCEATDAEKIVAFDTLRKMLVDHQLKTLREFKEHGTYNEDDDNSHYAWEEAVEGAFGRRFFDGYNILHTLMDQAGEN